MTVKQGEKCQECGKVLELYEFDNRKGVKIMRCKQMNCRMYHYYKRDKYGRWILLKAVLPDFPLTEKEETTAKKKFSFSKNIFIVHGREAKPKLELARILEKLGFNTIILSEQPDKGRTIIEKLEEESIEIGYAFVILTPDDFGGSIEELRKVYERWKDVEEAQEIEKVFKARARQNVVLELGYFVGKIGRNRVCCLYKGEVELPSDIHGVLFKKFNESVEECYKGIIEELKAAGYDIKI